MSGYRRERIKELRVAAGLDQYELAERAGTNQGDISRIERGATKHASGAKGPAKVRQLAKALGTNAADIYDDPADSLEFQPEPGDEAPASDDGVVAPMKSVLLRLAGGDEEGSYTFDDVDVVRATIEAVGLYMGGADPPQIVRSWLRAARYLRLRNIKATIQAVLARAQVGASMQAEAAQVEGTERTAQEASTRAHELGLGDVSPKAKAVRGRATATVEKSRRG